VFQKHCSRQKFTESTVVPGHITSAVLLWEATLRAFQQQLLHADVAAYALQQLLQELLQELASLMPFADEAATAQAAAAGSDDAADLPHRMMCLVVKHNLTHTLSVFAGQVVAQLPLRWACNHPGCVALGAASELALVGGKGCVCSGAR
jgi:hypothetical protein